MTKLKEELLSILQDQCYNISRRIYYSSKQIAISGSQKYFNLRISFTGNEFIDSFSWKQSYNREYYTNNIDSITLLVIKTIKNLNERIKNDKTELFNKADKIIKKYKMTKIPDFIFDYQREGMDDIVFLSKLYTRYRGLSNRLYLYKKFKRMNLHEDKIKKLNKKFYSQNKKPIVFHEKKSRSAFNKLLFPLLKSKGYKVQEEFKISQSSNHRIDYLISKDDFIIGIEYKSSNASWSKNHLERQKELYETFLKEKFPNINVIIVSDTGRYGISNYECLELFT